MLGLMRNAVLAAQHRGVSPALEDPASVETQLRTIAQRPFLPHSNAETNTHGDARWPAHLEPLPSARLALAALYLEQGKPVPALRNALRGALPSRRHGPAAPPSGGRALEWANGMMDLVMVLLAAAGVAAPAGEDGKGFPAVDDLRTVACGYLYEACRVAGEVFGGRARYTKGICELFGAMVDNMPGNRPGSREFKGEFEEAQKRVVRWAGVSEVEGVKLSY